MHPTLMHYCDNIWFCRYWASLTNAYVSGHCLLSFHLRKSFNILHKKHYSLVPRGRGGRGGADIQICFESEFLTCQDE